MRAPTWRGTILLTGLLLAFAEPALAQNKTTPAEKLKAVLDQNVTLDWTGQSFNELCNHLKDKTGVAFALDTQTLQMLGIGLEEVPVQVSIKGTNVKLRTALQRTLDQFGLVPCVLGESVLITTEEMAQYRQLRQRVSINVKNESLESALKKLAREVAVNIVIDSKVADQAKDPVTLQLDEDVPLCDAIRLLTFTGGMRSVRVGSVLFVTSADRAKTFPPDTLLPRANDPNQPNGMTFPFQQRVLPFNVPPGAGIGGRAVPGNPGVAPPGIPVQPDGAPAAPPRPAPPRIDPPAPPQREVPPNQ